MVVVVVEEEDEEQSKREAHAISNCTCSVVTNTPLSFSPHVLQNSAVWIISCGMLGNGLPFSLQGILGHLPCKPFFLSRVLVPEAA